jgi:multiple sugar transport system permease protein
MLKQLGFPLWWLVKTLLIYTLLIAMAMVFLTPYIWMFVSSLKPHREIFQYTFPLTWQTFVPLQPTFENYRLVFTNVPFTRYILNTIYIAIAVCLGSLFINSLAAYGFARLHFPGRDLLFFTLLATMIVPGEVLMIPLFVVVKNLGWIDSYRAIIVPGLAGVFGIFFLRQAFLEIPIDLEDAARIDGCNPLQIYYQVMLPLIQPALLTLALITFIGNWDSFLWPLVVLNTPDKMVIQVGIATFQAQYFTYWGQVFAASVVASFPIIIIFLFLQRQYVQGVISTGLKF